MKTVVQGLELTVRKLALPPEDGGVESPLPTCLPTAFLSEA